MLLSSMLVYNSQGTISETALNNLDLVLRLCRECLAKNDGIDDEAMKRVFPYFLWVLRDFTLQLVDNDNNSITSKQYLERSLQEQPGSSDQIEMKNRI